MARGSSAEERLHYLYGDAERVKLFSENCFKIMDDRYVDGMSVTAQKLLQYDVITEEFSPVVFKTVPYFYETGVLPFYVL